MTAADRRLSRERRTLEIMIRIFCRGVHGSRPGLCTECSALRDYALDRLRRCPYGGGKPACSHCTTHCYKKDMRARIQEVMRYSGPRMLTRHPCLSLRHLLDLKKSPEVKAPGK
ncbi:MAG: nitrous oxide-stimulated promoter family protein [Desulfomonilia bacterium]|jgi:hypothetical protein